MNPGVKSKRGGMLPSFLAFFNPGIRYEVRVAEQIPLVMLSVVMMSSLWLITARPELPYSPRQMSDRCSAVSRPSGRRGYESQLSCLTKSNARPLADAHLLEKKPSTTQELDRGFAWAEYSFSIFRGRYRFLIYRFGYLPRPFVPEILITPLVQTECVFR